MRTERAVLRAERLFRVARVNTGIESVLGRERRCLGGLVRGEATYGGLTAWGLGFEVSGQQARTAIRRGFAKQSAELASSLILKDGNEGAAVKYNRLDKKDHSVKDSSDFWGVFGFNLMQKESEMSMMQVILAEIPAPLRNSIMEKLNIMYTICAIHPDLQLLYISRDLNGLIAKSSPEQIEHYQQQYLILCNLIQESIPYMSPSICLDFLRLMQANKFYSHPISVGLFNNMYSRRFSASADLSDQDFCKSIDYLNLTLKRYILPASDPTDWGVARQLMSELMNYNNMNYMLDRSIEFCQNDGAKLNPYFVADLISSLEQMASGLPINNPKKLFIIRVVSAWLYRECPSFEKQTLGQNQKILNVIVSIVSMGGSSAPLRKVTTDLETTMLNQCRSSRESFNVVMGFLRVYTQQIIAEKELFERNLRPILVEFMREHILKVTLPNLALMANYMMLFSWRDPELAELLVQGLNHHFPDFQTFIKIRHQHRSQLHKALNYLLLRRFFSLKQVEDLKRISDYLNADCICRRFDRELTAEPFLGLTNEGYILYPERQDSPQVLWCVGHEASTKLCLEDNPTVRTRQNFTQDNYTEVLTKRALKDVVADAFEPQLDVSDSMQDIAVCAYKWDFVLTLEGLHKRIGFEVSGLSYRDQERQLAVKKKVKIDYLVMVGYLPIVLDISSKGLKTLYTEGKLREVGSYLTVLMMVKIAQLGGKVVKLKPGKYQNIRSVIINQVELLETKERAILLDLQTETEFEQYLESLTLQATSSLKN